jgi:hypothetical protein
MHEITATQAIVVRFNDPAAATGKPARIAQDNILRAGGLAWVQDFTFEKFTSERIAAIPRLISARQAGHVFKASPIHATLYLHS